MLPAYEDLCSVCAPGKASERYLLWLRCRCIGYNRTSMKLSSNSLSVLFAAAGIAAALFLSGTTLFSRMELDSIDLRFRLRGEGKVDPRLKLIAIDDRSIDSIGKFPWRRLYYAQMLQALSNFDPACVALDLLLSHSDEESIDDDRALAQIVRLMESALLSYYFSFGDAGEMEDGDLPPPIPVVKGDPALLPPASGVVLPALPYRGIGRIGHINTPRDPSDPLCGGNNSDGVIREIPLVIRYGKGVYPSLALRAVMLGLGADASDVSMEIGRSVTLRWDDLGLMARDLREEVKGDRELMQLVGVVDEKGLTPHELVSVLKSAGGGRRTEAATRLEKILRTIDADDYVHELVVPIDERGRMLINYAAKYGGFNSIPFEEVLDEFRKLARGGKPDFDLKGYRGAVTFIGATATGLDTGQIPLTRHSPLIAVHLNAANTMLTGEFMREMPYAGNVALSVLLGALAWLFSYRLPYARGTLILVLVAAMYIFAAGFLFCAWNFVMGVVAPMLCLISSTMTTTAFRLVVVDREKRHIKRALSHYVTREIMEEVLRNPAALKLGGARKKLTVLFSDICGFTKFCEGRRPEEVVARLNEYMDEMTEAIFNHRGTLDKYVGDEIVAIFGAPRDETKVRHAGDPKTDALNAVMAALEMRERLGALQERWRVLGLEIFEMGIGINTGEMIVGNMGSKKVMDYTVIGDEVNLGARVEGLTREYDAPILITGSTYECVRDAILAERVGEVRVKGRERLVTVYRVLGLKDQRVKIRIKI